MNIKKKCCNQCLFTKNKIVSDARRDSIVRDCLKNDSHFICHKSTIEHGNDVCTGFAKKYSSQSIRISDRLGLTRHVD